MRREEAAARARLLPSTVPLVSSTHDIEMATLKRNLNLKPT